MDDDPNGLSYCAMTRWATHLAFAHRRGEGRPAALENQSPAFGLRPQPGAGCDYSRRFRGKGHLAQLSRGFCTLAGLSLATTLPVVSVPCCLMAGLSVRD